MVWFAKLIPSEKFILFCQMYLATLFPVLGMGCEFLTTHSALLPLVKFIPPRGALLCEQKRHPTTLNGKHFLSDGDYKWFSMNENRQLN